MTGEQSGPQAPAPRSPRAANGLRRHSGLWLALVGIVALGAWVLNVSRPGSRVEGCAAGCAQGDASRHAQRGHLRVLSMNVRHGFPRHERLRERLDLIAGEIRRQEVDIACLQEVPWTPGLGSGAQYLARRTGLNHLYLRANGNRWAILFEEGEVILSRYPLRDVAVYELRPRVSRFEHRVVLQARAVTPWGEMSVYATHLTHGDPAIRRAQLASLHDLVAAAGDGPAVIAGDLNAAEGVVHVIAADWVDTYRAVHPADPGLTCCIDDLTPDLTDTARPEDAAPSHNAMTKRIDYVLLGPGAAGVQVVDSERFLDQPVSVDEGWLWASDHVGVLSTLAMRQ